MMGLKSIMLTGGALLALASVAQAADLPTRKAPPVPEKPNCFASFWTWLDSTPTDCPLSYWGVTFYGQVDVGGGYSTNKARFNPYNQTAVGELVSKQSHGAGWQGVPNGLGTSNIGIRWKEQIVPDWFFIGDVNAGFDPYSLEFLNGPRSLVSQNATPQFFQSYNSDSSRTYGVINTRAYAGVQNKTFGTLTYGRQYAFSNDIANSLYDPQGGSNAFSLIGNSSTFGGGLGNTELARYSNSIKYLYADHSVRVGAMSQIGGWNAGNSAKYAFEVTGGFDWNGFSVDAVYEHAKDAVNLSTFSGPNAISPTLLRATLSNENSFQIAGKYKWDKFTFYTGYAYERLSNPDDLPAGPTISYLNGGVQAIYGAAGGGTQGNAFPVPKVQQVIWTGAKYALLPNLDAVGAYYHVWQNNYLGATQTAVGSNSCLSATTLPNNGLPSGTPANTGYVGQGTASAKCAGHEDAISGSLDWRPYKRVDVYGGVMFSKVNGGLANGFFVNSNTAFTGGVRVSF